MSSQYNREMITLGRQLRGLTRTELAKLSGLSQSHLTRVENGDRPLTDEIANSIADALGRPLDFCVGKANYSQVLTCSIDAGPRRESAMSNGPMRSSTSRDFA